MGQAYFVKRPRIVEDLLVLHPVDAERPYEVVMGIVLPAIDYENFVTDMLADRSFLADPDGRYGAGDIMKCICVRQKDLPGGVLVVPDGTCHVLWAAYDNAAE